MSAASEKSTPSCSDCRASYWCSDKQTMSRSTLTSEKWKDHNILTGFLINGVDNTIYAASVVKRQITWQTELRSFFAEVLHPDCDTSYRACMSCFFPTIRFELLCMKKEELIMKIGNSSILSFCLSLYQANIKGRIDISESLQKMLQLNKVSSFFSWIAVILLRSLDVWQCHYCYHCFLSCEGH